MGNLIATQVDPENQESPLMTDGMDDIRMQEVILIGDRERKSGNPELIDFIEKFERYCDDFEDIIAKSSSSKEAVNEMIAYFEYGDDYTPSRDINDWKTAIKMIDTPDEEPLILTCLTGKKYVREFIKGLVQSDWADLVHPASWTTKDVNHFEAEYFNTGNEWLVIPTDDPDNTFDIYTYSWSDEGAKVEIAKAFDTEPDNILLRVFDGYEKIPKYRLL